jgi:hypothetical protein
METYHDNLRHTIDKWLAPTPAAPVHAIRLCRMQSSHVRYVRVETIRSAGVFALLLFRHDDGTWQVFPPAIVRTTMNPLRLAA